MRWSWVVVLGVGLLGCQPSPAKSVGLMFGSAEKGWREVASFGSQKACEEEKVVRAREVREKSKSQPPLEEVLAHYRCVETPQ